MRNGPIWLTFVAAAAIWTIAWLVRSRQRVGLLNFVDPGRVADRAGLGRFAGNLLYVLGGLIAAFGAAVGSGLVDDRLASPVLVAMILALAAWLCLGAQNYLKP